MAYFRMPGPLGLFLGAAPPDEGTKARSYSPPPVPVGGASKASAQLSDGDLEFLEKMVGKGIDGHVLPLPALARSHDRMMAQYAEAVKQFGAMSQSASFSKAALVRLEQYMAEAKRSRGKAAERLSQLLKQTEDPRAAVSDAAISAAIAKVLAEEHAAAKRDPSGDPSGSAMTMVFQAAEVLGKRKEDALAKLVEQARRPGNKVTESQLSAALGTVLAGERQRQLLGAGDGGGRSRAMDLMIEVIDIAADRREQKLKALIEDAKKKGTKVTDKQLQEAVAGVLGAERQKQLLGAVDDNPSRAMSMVSEVMTIAKARHKQELGTLLQRARQPGNTVARRQIEQAVAKVLGDERQSQLLGASDDGTTAEVMELLETATKVYAKRPGERAKRRPRRPVIMADEVKIYGRVPVK